MPNVKLASFFKPIRFDGFDHNYMLGKMSQEEESGGKPLKLLRVHRGSEESQQRHLEEVLRHFQVDRPTLEAVPAVEALHIGLINDTWYVSYLPGTSRQYVLQRVNHKVFKSPTDIDANIRLLAQYVQQHYPSMTFLSCVPLHMSNNCVLCVQEYELQAGMSEEDTLGYYRVFHYIQNSYTLCTVDNTFIAYEAAKGFGQFCSIFHRADASNSTQRQEVIDNLKVTLSDFHNLTLRQQQYQAAITHCHFPDRFEKCTQLIHDLHSCLDIPQRFIDIAQGSNAVLKSRVTHHDCKISNILLSSETHQGTPIVKSPFVFLTLLKICSYLIYSTSCD